MNCSVYAAFMIWKGTDETMVDIQCKDGKYIIDARIIVKLIQMILQKCRKDLLLIVLMSLQKL
mgnify:CR=1 FL=1